jgi:hypothetical protein
MRRRYALVTGVLALVVGAGWALPAAATHGVDTEVTVGSEDEFFSQNKQNEPAVAINPVQPNVVVAGANDNIDMELCNAGDPTTCPFTEGVGVTGVQWSFDRGDSWIQPTYTGWTARHCVGDPDPTVTTDECEPAVGPIGTLPWYFENGLIADGDPAMAWGPQPDDNGDFSWANGPRLYFATLAGAFPGEEPFKGFEAIAVSRLDGTPAVTPAVVADKNSWMPPVIASKNSSSTVFSDKEQIWADNAASSPHFGNAYVCFAEFRSQPGASAPLIVLTSRDGGDTWASKQVSAAHNVPPNRWGQSGCTIRTDSEGVVYVFFEQFQSPFEFLPPQGTHMVVKSFDGGRKWTRPEALYQVTDPCFFVDPITFRCVEDGIAGARNDLAAAPSVDIANGAPTGANATDLMVVAWADGRDGLNNEHVMISHSTDGAETWSDPVEVESDPDDRGFYAAPALSPDGTDVYVVYNAFTTPFRNDTTSPRTLVGVVLHGDVVGGVPGPLTEVHRGAEGDARGSAQNNLAAEFLGDYVYADATNGYATAVWNDARQASVCPAINQYWADLRTEGAEPVAPAPNTECPPFWGNSDIWGWSGLDPS